MVPRQSADVLTSEICWKMASLQMKKRFAVLLFVLLSFSVQEGFAQTPSSDLKTASDNLRRQQAVPLPDNVLNAELLLLGGKTLKLSEYSGKVVLINLFATWCLPCRFESPDLAKLHRELKDHGFVVIELSTENPQASKKSVRQWVRNFRLPYPVGWATQEVASTLMQVRQALPQSFLIGRDSRIVKRFIGYNSTKTPSDMREAVEEALK